MCIEDEGPRIMDRPARGDPYIALLAEDHDAVDLAIRSGVSCKRVPPGQAKGLLVRESVS